MRRRRALVLTNEAARHPFRASLPPHVFIVQRDEPEVEEARRRAEKNQTISDIKSVGMISLVALSLSYISSATLLI